MISDREDRAGLTALRQTYLRMVESAVRQGTSGWRFYDNQGRSFALSDDEGETLADEARSEVNRLMRGLDGNSWVMMIPAVLVGMFGLKMASEFHLIGAMPTAVYFVPCLLFLFKDAGAEVRYLFTAMHWREDIADRLRARDGRSHEKCSYAWFFDPRLAGWVLKGAGIAALFGLLALSGMPFYATLLIVLGLALLGGATLMTRQERA
jgi:hypothetical protein